MTTIHESPSQIEQAELLDLVEQLTDLMQSGDRAAIEKLLHEHPNDASRLREFVRSLEVLAEFQLAQSSPTTSKLVASPAFVSGVLGDFRILHQIGRGGMGVVFEAEQISIPRKVALKILPLAALVDHRALQRFKNEVAAIATLQHPHIVAVYSIGEERGIHYFAMQLIRGQSLAAVIRELRARSDQNQRLSGDALNQAVSDIEKQETAQAAIGSKDSQSQEVGDLDETKAETVARGRSSTVRNVGDPTYFFNVARLIQQAAEALQHAHDHGIVHRDVKPGNLLLDSSGTLFVTDFGLARIETGAGVTMTGDVLGTLRYMSPEQVLGNRVVVDHRTDVYSLGATLYELLALQPMRTGDDKAGLIRQISFEEPTRPQKINPAIPTDLETVILKAITKSPADRYDSAQALADDLQRFLDNKTVVAKRPTIVQRINKWSRRNPAVVWSMLLLLIVATIASAVSAVLISNQKELATAAAEKERIAKDGERTAREHAEQRLAQLVKGNEIITSIFEDLDIGSVRQGDEPLEAVLAKRLLNAATELESASVGDPEVVARMQDSLGQSLFNLGFPADATALFRLSLETLLKTHGQDDLKALTTKANLASALLASGDISGSIRHFEEIYPILQEKLGDDHLDTTAIVANLAKAYHAEGNPKLAFELYEQVFQRRKSQLGERDPATLKAMNGLAGMYYSNGQSSKALPLFEDVVRLRIEVLGETHKDTLNAMNNLASVYQAIGDYERAIPLCEKNHRLNRMELGADHPNTLNGINNLANAYLSTGRVDVAITLLEENMPLIKEKLPADHPLLLTFMNNLARGYATASKFDLAVPLYLSILESRRSKLGEEHSSTLLTMTGLAGAYSSMGLHDKSTGLYEEVLRLREKTIGRANKSTQRTIALLGIEYVHEGRFEEAIPLLEESLESVDIDPELMHFYAAVRKAYFQTGRTNDLKNAVELQLAKSRTQFAEESPMHLAEMLESIGSDLLEFGDVIAAVDLFTESFRLRSKTAPDDWETFFAQFELGAALLAARDFAGAELNLVEGYAGMEQRRKAHGSNALPGVEQTIRRIIDLYELAERPADVQKWQEKLSSKPEPVGDSG